MSSSLNGYSNGALAPTAPSPGPGHDEFQLGELLKALRRRKRLALSVFAASLLTGALYTAWQRARHPVFQGEFKLLVSDPINTEERTSDGGLESLERVALPGARSTNVTATLTQVLTSPLLLAPIERSLGLPEGVLSPTITIPMGARGTGGDPGVLQVALEWGDPVQGQAILERISKEYLAYSLRQRQEKLSQGLAFLDQQAPELQARVAALQNQIADFRQSTGFVEPSAQADAIKGQQLLLSTQSRELEQQQARLEGEAAALRRGHLTVTAKQTSTPNANAPSQVGNGPTNLSEDLFEVERQLAEAEAIYTDNAPQVLELRSKRNKLRPLLQRRELDKVLSQLSENHSQLAEIRLQEEQLARRFQGNPTQMKQYEALQQQLVVARDNLTSYIKARENFRLQVAQRTVPWSVMSKPRFSSKPVKPNVLRGLFTSALLGALAGVGLALIRDRFDHVFHTPTELKDSLTVPLLGVVPHLPGGEGNTISQSLALLEGSDRFAINESLRNLYANFRLLRVDKPLRLVAITSSTPREGKTISTALFAQTLAQMGQRVLVVDADLRRPQLHRHLGVDNTGGFSSLLTDPQLEVGSQVRQVQNGLDVVTAGPVPPDPTQLLCSTRCTAVVEGIRHLPGYDLVLFDTPPALLLSDAVFLAEHLDGLIFLVGLSRVNRDLPAQALKRVRDTGVDVLGVLANQPLARGSRVEAHGYSHQYGYESFAEHSQQREADDHPTHQAADHVRMASKSDSKSLKKHFVNLKTRSQRLMQWLDERG